MIDCRQANNLFDVYLDGELGGSLTTELHAHVLACDDCRLELALHKAGGDVVAADRARPQLSGDFTDRVIASWKRQRAQAPARRRIIPLWVGPAAAAAAVLALVVLTLNNSWPAQTYVDSAVIDVRPQPDVVSVYREPSAESPPGIDGTEAPDETAEPAALPEDPDASLLFELSDVLPAR